MLVWLWGGGKMALKLRVRGHLLVVWLRLGVRDTFLTPEWGCVRAHTQCAGDLRGVKFALAHSVRSGSVEKIRLRVSRAQASGVDCCGPWRLHGALCSRG